MHLDLTDYASMACKNGSFKTGILEKWNNELDRKKKIFLCVPNHHSNIQYSIIPYLSLGRRV
jgi:hypothetical protein